MKKIVGWILVTGLAILLLIMGINFWIVQSTAGLIYSDITQLPAHQTVLVLGAKVNGEDLSLVLEDRVQAGIGILQEGKADTILLSGDHGSKTYDEVNAMRRYVQKFAPEIKDERIFLDHAGFDTYDSLYRAKAIFQANKLIVVTQPFHIHRAVYIANKLGLHVVGYAVNQDSYPQPLQAKWQIREWLSRVKAFLDVHMRSEPTYLGETIPIDGDGRNSWDEL